MKRQIVATAVLTAGLLLQPALAQPGPGGGTGGHSNKRSEECFKQGEGPGCLHEELNLTEEQKEKLHALREKGKAARMEHMEKMKGVREKMKAELAKEKPDGKMLMKFAAQTADLVENMTKQRIDHLLEVKKILNKEQFEKLLSKEMAGHERHNKGQKQLRPRRHGKQGPAPEGDE